MSFFGNNSRPDLKANAETNERGRISEAKFLGEVGKLGSEPPPPAFSSEPRASGSTGPTPPDKCTNVVAVGAKWKGTLTVDDSVRVDGIFTGEIHSKATVHVAEGAQVDAKIRAAFVVVAGSFQGEIRCDQRTDLLPRSRVNGEIITKVFTVHEGATFDGTVQMTGENPRLSSSRARNGSSEAEAPERRRTEAGASAE